MHRTFPKLSIFNPALRIRPLLTEVHCVSLCLVILASSACSYLSPEPTPNNHATVETKAGMSLASPPTTAQSNQRSSSPTLAPSPTQELSDSNIMLSSEPSSVLAEHQQQRPESPIDSGNLPQQPELSIYRIIDPGIYRVIDPPWERV